MKQRKIGDLLVDTPPNLTLYAVYPFDKCNINLNTCADPDCGNYGKTPNPVYMDFAGRNAQKKRFLASVADPLIGAGQGSYILQADKDEVRVSKVFEYQDAPHAWSDGRSIRCGHARGNGVCGVQSKILSNDFLEEEIQRLLSQNGHLTGPKCKACGAEYLKRHEEFVFSGTSGKLRSRKSEKSKPASFRLIHKPCKGKAGSRISVSLDHQKQRELHDNVRILRALVNGESFNDILRLLQDPDTGKRMGVSRLYARIHWLEGVLLAFENAKLKEWRDRKNAEGPIHHMRIAHDDITISCNWESAVDRRLTPIQCSVSADIESGYVFRIDPNFDPSIDPVQIVKDNYLDGFKVKGLNQTYRQASGLIFTAPRLHFQRPTGRFDEAHLFSSAVGRWAAFSAKIGKAYELHPSGPQPIPKDQHDHIRHSATMRDLLDKIRFGYFDFGKDDRDYRGSFNGALVKQTYTKAAHLFCVKELLPAGRITLVGEQEATMVRCVPHVFRDMINEDLFEWHVITFDKTVSKPKTQTRIGIFNDELKVFRKNWRGPKLSNYDMLREFCAENMRVAVGAGKKGEPTPFPISNFQGKQFPQIWLRSPAQIFGETDKVIGFPILRREYRKRLKRAAFDSFPKDPILRRALARRMLRATVQPVSVFMNSVRSRLSPTVRAGGNASRNGPSYINGALFNPAVLISLLNIYRVYFNWFEPRRYTGAPTPEKSTIEVEGGDRLVKIPGSDEVVIIPKRRGSVPILTTPAMRLGADVRPSAKSNSSRPLDPRRVFYRPWLFHSTPLWKRFEQR